MTKTMCKKKPEKRKIILAKEAKYECKKCRATADKQKHLCKPEKVN
jgi:hypothetical protein